MSAICIHLTLVKHQPTMPLSMQRSICFSLDTVTKLSWMLSSHSDPSNSFNNRKLLGKKTLLNETSLHNALLTGDLYMFSFNFCICNFRHAFAVEEIQALIKIIKYEFKLFINLKMIRFVQICYIIIRFIFIAFVC